MIDFKAKKLIISKSDIFCVQLLINPSSEQKTGLEKRVKKRRHCADCTSYQLIAEESEEIANPTRRSVWDS